MDQMSESMQGVWFCFVLCFSVAAAFFQLANVPNTKFPLVFGKSGIRRLIEGNGFGYENYSVTTEDGYILNLNRIIHPNKTSSDRRYPILLVNGYFMQSEAWLVNRRLDSNIALRFADQGYDVWLGDQRGTMRSKEHVNLTTKDKEFWDFTFHEIGMYDIPAFVDFILKKTSYDDLIFTCMSLGCSYHAVFASKRPSYNQKIRAAIYLVPVVNNIRKMSDMNSLTLLWFRHLPLIVDVFEKSGQHDWFPFIGNLKKEIYHLCRTTPPIYLAIGLKLNFGRAFHLPPNAVCYIAASSLGGANPKCTKHILQMYESGDFAEYDYGREENKKRYGTEWAPLYDMHKITSPVAIYYSDADVFLVPEVEKTIRSLGGPTYSCKLPSFNHLDVAAGTTFRFILPDIVDLLHSLTGKGNDTEKFKSGECPSKEWIRYLQ